MQVLIKNIRIDNISNAGSVNIGKALNITYNLGDTGDDDNSTPAPPPPPPPSAPHP